MNQETRDVRPIQHLLAGVPEHSLAASITSRSATDWFTGQGRHMCSNPSQITMTLKCSQKSVFQSNETTVSSLSRHDPETLETAKVKQLRVGAASRTGGFSFSQVSVLSGQSVRYFRVLSMARKRPVRWLAKGDSAEQVRFMKFIFGLGEEHETLR